MEDTCMSVELVRRAQRGDRVAFDALVFAALGRLYPIAALILHDSTLAEDAVQETVIRAWRSLPGLRDAGRYDVWLRQILVHACIDAARRERRYRGDHELREGLADRDDLETLTADRDAIEQAFATLSPQHRAAFVLRHYAGYRVAEVADALRVPLGTAKSRIHYAERAMSVALHGSARPLWEARHDTAQ